MQYSENLKKLQTQYSQSKKKKKKKKEHMVEPLQDFRIHVADKDTDPKNQTSIRQQVTWCFSAYRHGTGGNTWGPTGTSFRFIIARQKQLSATW